MFSRGIFLTQRYTIDDNAFFCQCAQTNRTAAACFRAYNLRPHQPHEPWTAEDDALLLSSVYRWGQNWSLVSRMVGHSIPSAVVRFNSTLAPGYTRGRWTEEEDMALRRAVVKCGVGNWAEVSERVKGKSDSQCRERWTNSVDPRIVGYANWTREVSVVPFSLRTRREGLPPSVREAHRDSFCDPFP